MSRPFAVVPLMLVAAALPAQRPLILTGPPLARLAEPFSQITGVRELPDGRVVVTDARERLVHLADFAAGTTKRISRNGAGPGEYQFPFALYPAHGGDSWLIDPMLKRMLTIAADGKVTATAPIPTTENDYAIGQPRAADAAFRIYFQGQPRPRDAGDGRASFDSLDVIRWDPKSGKQERIARVPSGISMGRNEADGRTILRMSSGPFSANVVWTALPDGRLALVHPSPYRVDIVTVGGGTVRGPVQPYTPLKVTAADREAYRKSIAGAASAVIPMGGNTSVTPSPISRKIADDEFPATFPPFLGNAIPRVTPEGELWVPRVRTAAEPDGSYDVFDGTGTLVSRVRVPRDAAVVGFGAGVVYLSVVDPADDLRYLVKYRR